MNRRLSLLIILTQAITAAAASSDRANILLIITDQQHARMMSCTGNPWGNTPTQDTLIVFTSDHGDLDGAHRLEHKSFFYEEAARAPFIVSQKGTTRAGHIDDEPTVSTGLDIIPTLCDSAGIQAPAGLHGRSVWPLAEGRDVETWREGVVSEPR